MTTPYSLPKENSMPMARFQIVFTIITAMIFPNSIVKGQTGFLNIDCGLPSGSSYTEIGLAYTPDEDYISSGEIKQIDQSYSNPSESRIYSTLRAFRDFKRNCYEFRGLAFDTTYLVRASFKYGNYDGLNKPPKFDLYFGLDLWYTVEFENATETLRTELQFRAVPTPMRVCLVQTDQDMVPFISGLEIRPLTHMWTITGSSLACILLRRISLGGTAEVRYPDDKYDRIWMPDYNNFGTPINITQDVKIPEDRLYEMNYFVPSAVMKTAVLGTNIGSPIVIEFPLGSKAVTFSEYHFAELQANVTGTETFVLHDGSFFNYTFSPQYLIEMTVLAGALKGGNWTRYKVTIESTVSVPILNALQVFYTVNLSNSSTDSQDTAAISDIRSSFHITKNWVGDPCLPSTYPWAGLTCTSASSIPIRIISLDVSNSNLTGNLSASFAKFSALESLNLSQNPLEGSLVALDGLTNLTTIDISCTKLTNSSLPRSLQERVDSGALVIRSNNSCTHNPTNKSMSILIIGLVVAVTSILLVAITLVIVFRMKKKPRKGSGYFSENLYVY